MIDALLCMTLILVGGGLLESHKIQQQNKRSKMTMPKGKSNFVRPIGSDGKPMITVKELSARIGLSEWHIRERTRPNPRGRFIPSHKIGTQIWFEESDALAAIYNSRKRVDVPVIKQVVDYI